MLFYDANTLELKKQLRLQDAYWFPAMAVYPDVCDPEVIIGEQVIAQGETRTISLLDAVRDADNMPALAVSTAVSGNASVVQASVKGLALELTGVALGRTQVTVTTDSNGKLATTTFTVTVTGSSKPGDVNMDGKVSIDDVTDLIDILLGSVLTVYDMNAADVDRDGKITIADVTALIDMLLSGH